MEKIQNNGPIINIDYKPFKVITNYRNINVFKNIYK